MEFSTSLGCCFILTLQIHQKKKYSYQKLFKDKIYFFKCINLQGIILGFVVAANHFQKSEKLSG
jgi:hypothetical protein